MSKIVAVSCLKGGVGKTTTVLSSGGILAAGSRVLLVDLDPQANLTRSLFVQDFNDTIYEAFVRRSDIPVVNVRENLDLVPSCIDACGIETEFQSGEKSIGREFILKTLLKPLEQTYDWIIIDCPAHLGTATANALVAADRVVVPMCCDAYSASGLIQIQNFMNIVRTVNPALACAGVLVTRFRRSRLVDRIVVEELRNAAGSMVFNTLIRENTALVQAPTHGKDIWVYDSKSNGARDYSAFIKELETKF